MDDIIREKIKKGDRELLGVLFKEVKDQAYKVAYGHMNNQQDSLDVICNSVEKAILNIKKLKDPDFFKTWFIRIVINECKMQIRRRETFFKKAKKLFTENDNKCYHDEYYIDLNILLKNMKSDERELIYLRYYLGYTLEEVATVLDLPLGTVKTKLYCVLKNMKKKLELKEVY